MFDLGDVICGIIREKNMQCKHLAFEKIVSKSIEKCTLLQILTKPGTLG